MTKSPARKAEHQEKHDEVQGISTVLRTRKKDKKATGEAHAVQEQDNPLQTKSPAMTQDKQHKKNDGAHTTAALSQGSEFVPSMEHIAPFISSFKKDFQNPPSEVVKKNLCWQVLALSHDKSPLPFVDDALEFIRENLEKKDKSVR